MQARLLGLLLALLVAPAFADEYDDTVKTFREAGQSSTFFARAA